MMKGKSADTNPCIIIQLCHCWCTPKFFTFKWFSNATLHHFNFSIFYSPKKQIEKFSRLISVKWSVICLNIHNICLIARSRERELNKSDEIFIHFWQLFSSSSFFAFSVYFRTAEVSFSGFLLCCCDNKFLLYLFSLLLLLMFSQLGLNGDGMKG